MQREELNLVLFKLYNQLWYFFIRGFGLSIELKVRVKIGDKVATGFLFPVLLHGVDLKNKLAKLGAGMWIVISK